jgi:hypothetical protein
MTNENAIFELNKIKFKNNELPMPIYNKTEFYIVNALKSFKLHKENP